jgi:hypothetical protein
MFRMMLATVAIGVTTLAMPIIAQPQTPPSQTQPQPSPPATVPPQPVQPTTSTSPDASATGAPPTKSVADTEHGTALILLEHIQKVLDEAADRKTGDVTIERGMLDTIRAELTQVRRSLQPPKP